MLLTDANTLVNPTSTDAVRHRAQVFARTVPLLRRPEHGSAFSRLFENLQQRLKNLLLQAKQTRAAHPESRTALELLENARLFEASLSNVRGAVPFLLAQPHVRITQDGAVSEIPHVVALCGDYVSTVDMAWDQETLRAYIEGIQASDPLHLREILMLPAALTYAVLDHLLERGALLLGLDPQRAADRPSLGDNIRSLREIGLVEWRPRLEPMIAFEHLLEQDPARAYPQMDRESKEQYRARIAATAERSDANEFRVALTALELAREAEARGGEDPLLVARESHVGFYLVAEGFSQLAQRVGYRPTLLEAMRTSARRYADEVYIGGIEVMTVALMAAVTLPLIPHHFQVFDLLIAFFLALLPASQAAVDLINKLVTSLLDARALPKLDFSSGVPDSAATLVVVPTLLLNPDQVEELIETLEARYLNNIDPNIHFALLTDLPDSVSRPLPHDVDPLVECARTRIDDLNRKYGARSGPPFLLLHRQRVFNARQGVWMGWERKRGKLMDLNQLLVGRYDSFPVKVGDQQALEKVRFVITLDSDTQLPREAAHRLIGTMAHPLNRAIIDPGLRIVTKGYGIIQPRVGVSVRSASVSRFASIYSGDTGYDIYARAISDVYQDLYGEGIFTGKGIYDPGVLHDVLDGRFPRNHLLSHDLIEGAYARAGLATDVELIDDYPSHYTAHIRRNHRWVRGDWQIMRWLLPRVPDEQHRLTRNPISTISSWKILDNLRRSLVEPATFLLLFVGWIFLPGSPLYWTIAVLLFLILPDLAELAVALTRMLMEQNFSGLGDSLRGFLSGLGFRLLNLIFLPHHALLQTDAIVRALVRTFITQRRLLEWETAAESEVKTRRSAVDRYLRWMPAIALALGALLYWVYPPRLLPAIPILLLWAISPLVTRWLNGRKYAEPRPLRERELTLLRQTALHTWRYFAEFGGEHNRYFIPDHVEEEPLYQDRKLSPTNLGMLLNARQAALELGYLTLPEFVDLTERCLASYAQLARHRGHPVNWYDIDSLQPLHPQVVSTVDSGNLAASFYSLHAGALELLSRPLLEPALLHGIADCLAEPQRAENDFASIARALLAREQGADPGHPRQQDTWARQEADRRISRATDFLRTYAPWALPQHQGTLLAAHPAAKTARPTLAAAAGYARMLADKLPDDGGDATQLRRELLAAADCLQPLADRVRALAATAERFADEMDFAFLLVPSRKLLSIGYEVETGKLYESCYDLLASEARIAAFIAVAKNDVPQETWFRLDRTHALVRGRAVLLSWTGTMFEYMMPSLWMRSYPNALISQTLQAVPHIQREHVSGIPWGISESAYAKRDLSGRYSYQAWGIPELALKFEAQDGPVISPYSTFLALELDQEHALQNLQRMRSSGWFSGYGFYEAGDYIQSGKRARKEPEIVRSWMAHHQGMILLSLTNRLRDRAFQRWFHDNPRLRATELLLHEKPLPPAALTALDERDQQASR